MSYHKFLAAFMKKHPNLDYDQARKKAKAPYTKFKQYHDLRGGGIIDSINDFLANMLGKIANNAVTGFQEQSVKMARDRTRR